MAHNARLCKGMDRKLYRASGEGDVKLLDQVLKEGRVHALEEVTPADDTALHRAAFYGHASLATKLIQFASVNPEAGMHFLKAQNTDGNTALHAAAEGGCEEIVKELVEKERDMACVKNKAGETALFRASENGHVGIVECLLNYTPENEELDRRADGQTPLHVAVSQQRTGVTAKLLDKRPALVHKADVRGRTALHIIALTTVTPYIVISFISNQYYVSQKGKKIVQIGEMLLNKEVSLMYRVDANGHSAFHLGAKVGNVHLVKVILSYGPDCTEISDKDGRTALHLAVENASQAYDRVGQYPITYIISSLICGRLINSSDNSGQTAYDIAVSKTNEDKQLFLAIRAYLISKGARWKIIEKEDSPLLEGVVRKSDWSKEIITVNAVLIATVAFAAAFTLPGNIDTNANPPLPFLLNVTLFQLFILFDTMAFCSSFGPAVLLIYALFGNHGEEEKITSLCFAGLRVAVTCIALIFGAAIHLVVAHNCMWLAVLVWIMVCFLPFGITLNSMRGKLNMFKEYKTIPMLLLLDTCIQTILDMLAIVSMPPIVLFLIVACLWSYLVVPLWRMLVRILLYEHYFILILKKIKGLVNALLYVGMPLYNEVFSNT